MELTTTTGPIALPLIGQRNIAAWRRRRLAKVGRGQIGAARRMPTCDAPKCFETGHWGIYPSRMWDGTAFSGTKIALVCDGSTVAYLRDDKPEIPFPGMWDLPGGGREGDEAPIDCGLREVEEEFGLKLSPSDVILIERHPSIRGGLDTYFCAMKIGYDAVATIDFGDEGQRWELMPISDFVRHENAVPDLKDRLRAAVDAGII